MISALLPPKISLRWAHTHSNPASRHQTPFLSKFTPPSPLFIFTQNHTRINTHQYLFPTHHPHHPRPNPSSPQLHPVHLLLLIGCFCFATLTQFSLTPTRLAPTSFPPPLSFFPQPNFFSLDKKVSHRHPSPSFCPRIPFSVDVCVEDLV